MEHTIDRLPRYLRRYCVDQDYERYTPREHATWRCIMRQNRAYFADHAVGVYIDGLEKTGIPIERIPNIKEMDEKLSQFGYGAVGVVGFIPPAIFLEFQSLGIMPIATDIRTLEHVGYTPAPDIVHEAAGHVPVVADPDYRAYLSLYGKIANKSLSSLEDIRRYEAIRVLSDIKENPDTKSGEIAAAEKKLASATEAMTFVSEATKVGRMGWWTIEYGLVGSGDELKIYGAGLLSSVTESQNCLSPNVKKIPLTVDCVNVDFDITEPQPQLFVVPSLKELRHSLEQLQSTFSFVRGGQHGLSEAQRCQTLNTVQLDSGVEFCGVVERFECDNDQPVFVKLLGPSQICYDESVLDGHGKENHQDGFSAPIGRLKAYPDRSPALLTQDQLAAIGIRKDHEAVVEYISGFRVEGVIRNIVHREGKLILIQLSDCTVKRGASIYFQPEWGPFDLAIGERVSSVYSGPGDRLAYGEYDIGFASTYPGRKSPFSEYETSTFEIYSQLRQLREDCTGSEALPEELDELAGRIFAMDLPAREWLIYLELMELAVEIDPRQTSKIGWYDKLESALARCEHDITDRDTKEMIRRGRQLIVASEKAGGES